MKMTYGETVDYLFGLLPMYQRTGAFVGKFDLAKTYALLEVLGDPHRGRAFVHVAGTNGKGSVSHAIATLCTSMGLKTGLYTSPHYVDYRERIRIDGQMVEEAFVVDFVDAHRDLIERTGASFFEFTVAMAFAYFAERDCNIAVVEVGMGGRLDSTNVIKPLLSVITNIGLDHTEVLGETLELIAAEKAGIIKPGVPVLVGRHQDETWPVFERFAERLNSPLRLAGELVQMHEDEAAFRFRVAPAGEDEPWGVLAKADLSIRGPFAQENVTTALAAFAILREVYPGLTQVPDYRVLTRMEELSGYRGRYVGFRQNEQSARVIADAGHNPDGWAGIVPAVVAGAGGEHVHVVCGFVKGKKPEQFTSLWPAGTTFYIGQLDLPRAQPLAETLAHLSDSGPSVTTYATIAEAYASAQSAAAAHELIFVGGSSFVVGEWMGELKRFKVKS